MLSGSVGWGDASIIVPYTLYKRHGDVRILEENYEMMTRWYRFLEDRAAKSEHKYAIDNGIDYGEWCEPDVDSKKLMGKTQSVATAYLFYSGRLLAEIAELLKRAEDAAHYREAAEHARKAYHEVFTDHGKICSDRQCEYVRPLAFGLLNEKESIQAAADLNALVVKNEYHLNTGFLTTPYLCDVLMKYGYTETASRVLLQDTAPSWLYSVKKGANTIWETWEGIRPDGTVHESLNHYSYGTITGWFFKSVCGIRLEEGQLILAPKPLPALKHARAEYESPVGRIESEWLYEEDKIVYEFTIPANVQAKITLPDGTVAEASAGRHTFLETR